MQKEKSEQKTLGSRVFKWNEKKKTHKTAKL